MAAYGLAASFHHVENGMSHADMLASLAVADRLDEVIIFRSTGPWSRRWIERRYPTKNFHVKGKSSDWGPQAGFVPYLGLFSKVGHVAAKAEEGTAANDKGLRERYAATVQLSLAPEELQVQLTQPEEQPPRLALLLSLHAEGADRLLMARRSGDSAVFTFLARLNNLSGRYDLFACPRPGAHLLLHSQSRHAVRGPARPDDFIPLLVMTSSEVGAGNRPMTGDYDLMAVCPRWERYGQTSSAEISKDGLDFGRGAAEKGLSFRAGANLDAVLDMRTSTGAVGRKGADGKWLTFQGYGARDMGRIGLEEHNDMGNLTPRILRCINELNLEMGAVGAGSPLRRVHHNAESHRNHIFGALQADEMEKGDGFPLTVFVPKSANKPGRPLAELQGVATLETMAEFRDCARRMKAEGFFLPRNWTWGMSIRDQVRQPGFKPGASTIY